MSAEPASEVADLQKDEQSAGSGVDHLLVEHHQERYVFRLFVTGMSPLSLRAVATMKSLCETHLANRYELLVINLRDHPKMAREKDIVVTPTLIQELPLPIRRLVGDLSKSDRLLAMLL